MARAGSLLGSWRGAILVLAAPLVVAADQFSKTWVRSYPEGHVIYELGFLRLVHVQNTGASFGMFQGHSSVLMVVAAVGIVALLLLLIVLRRRFPMLAGMANMIALSLMLGGAVGNLIDRLLNDGSVTDFLAVGIWPAFNVADSSVVIGAAIAAYSLVRLTRAEKRQV